MADSAGIDPDDEGGGILLGPREHGSAVAGAEIEDHPVGPGDPLSDLADVHVGGAAADDLTHGPESTLGP